MPLAKDYFRCNARFEGESHVLAENFNKFNNLYEFRGSIYVRTPQISLWKNGTK